MKPQGEQMIKVGNKAPVFTLLNQDDEKTALKNFAGKWVVLYFYPRDNTSGCTKEAMDFTWLKRRMDRRDAVVIGVSPDSSESHRNFIKKYKLKVMLLSDPEKTVMQKYGAWGMKKMYGKEKEGVIRSTVLIGPDGRVAEIWSQVKVRVKRKDGEVKHAEKVLEKLDELK